jgi:3-oxoacid CoA-transferase subunit A
MVFITGDTHREFERIEEFCYSYDTEESDVLVILGDAGINFYGEPNDSELKMELIELPITLFCIHGNHEKRPESIKSYEETERFGGAVYWEPAFPNLLFAKCGEIYTFGGLRCIAIGGAYSVNKHQLKEGVSWWPDEQPSDEIKKRVEKRLEAEGWQVDIVFSHTSPYSYMPREAFIPGLKQYTVDNSTEKWLDFIERKLEYSVWYCGHFHTDKIDNKICFMSRGFRELY